MLRRCWLALPARRCGGRFLWYLGFEDWFATCSLCNAPPAFADALKGEVPAEEVVCPAA